MNVIIAGGGKVGEYLAAMLGTGGHQVRVIETQREHVARLERTLPNGVAMLGNATDPSALEAAGIRQANVVAAVTGSDETNLIVTNLARFEFGVPRTIARVNNPKNAWMFTSEMGVDVPVNQADLMAHLIAEEMSLGDMMTLVKLRKGQYSLVEEKVDPNAPAAGQALRDIRLPEACAIVAIIRKGELMLPRGDLVLQPVDEVLALASESATIRLGALLGARKV